MSEQHFSTPNPVRLDVKVAAGDLRVETIEGGQSTVALEGPSKLTEATHVELIGDRLVIEQRRKSLLSWRERWDSPLHVRVRVPRHSGVQIMTASGDAVLTGVFAGLETSSASGDLRLTGELDGDAIVKTVSGDVRLPRLSGDLTARTVSGDVDAEAVDGSLWVKSVSGDVRVGSLREGEAEIQSVSGNVALGIASGTSIQVDAGSASGMLTSEVPLTESPTGSEGPTVVIRSKTVSGDFRVFRAA